jgi:hypothetical protein
MMQQRRDEIAAKRNKLAELKRNREQRTREISSVRQSIGASDVRALELWLVKQELTGNSSYLQPPAGLRTVRN